MRLYRSTANFTKVEKNRYPAFVQRTPELYLIFNWTIIVISQHSNYNRGISEMWLVNTKINSTTTLICNNDIELDSNHKNNWID